MSSLDFTGNNERTSGIFFTCFFPTHGQIAFCEGLGIQEHILMP